MSSQNEEGIPFEIATDLHGLRLLELPPSLLDLIRSGNTPLLTLKSAAQTEDGQQHDAAHAVLCTQSQTFQVRQVQTSNSVFVVEPNERPATSASDESTVTSLRAIAKCPNMLELIPARPEATTFLQQKLPEYKIEHHDSASKHDGLELHGRKSKLEVVQDAPFSAGEFDEVWTEICAFEDRGVAWRPTTGLLVKCWGVILTAATIRGLQLQDTFPISAITSTAEEDGVPVAVIEAVLARLSADERESMDGSARLDRIKCVLWVGSKYLDSLGGEVAVSTFLGQWQDKLPEAWRADATLDKLKGLYRQTTSTTIIYDETASDPKSVAAADGAKASTKRAKPNWHERFKSTKK